MAGFPRPQGKVVKDVGPGTTTSETAAAAIVQQSVMSNTRPKERGHERQRAKGASP
jgi:hypothetical protein